MAKRLHLGKENLVYLGLWFIMFLTPVLTQYSRSHNSGIDFNWGEVFNIWKVYAAYLVVFLIHNFMLAPILIHRHKKVIYFATTLCLIALFIVYHCTQRPELRHPPGPPPHMMEMRSEGPRPPQDRMAPDRTTRPPFDEWDENHAPMKGQRNGKPRKEELPPLFFGQMDLVGAVVVILLIGMNLGIKLYFKSEERMKEMEKLEKQNLEQQLEYLKFQINPHFFMNTLNNIHALVDIEPEKAKSTILELSKLMRYVLYEGAKQTVPLSRDIEFLNNYITLMRLRYNDKVRINIDVPTIIPDTSIPPMLFITFVENAFKHGVSYQKESFIDIKMNIDEQRINFICRNNKHPESTAEQGGVGLANVKQRLALIYRENYALNIDDGEQEYNVDLTIPTQFPNNQQASPKT
ncbi:MAG: histidine kinase [Prevotella sp.]|nr:histidine kinase [Prevotella sp.]